MNIAMTRYRRLPDILWRRSLDAVLVLPREGTEPVTLGGTAPEVWELLAIPMTLKELATRLARAHDTDRDIVEADVGRLLRRLTELALIESVT